MIDPTKPSGYDAKHFERLVEVEDRHFWFASRNRMLAAVLAHVTVSDKARVLEIGTGTGNTFRLLERAFPRATLVGVDLFEEGLAAARLRTRGHLVRAKIEQLPFQREFELVGAFDVLEHVEDDRAALTHIRGLLAPAGYLVLTVPACARLWSRFDSDSHHFRKVPSSTSCASASSPQASSSSGWHTVLPLSIQCCVSSDGYPIVCPFERAPSHPSRASFASCLS